MELRVKEICKSKGITLQTLAERLGINRVNLSASIKGNPTLETMTKIAKALNVTVNELLPEEEKSIKGYVEFKNRIIKIRNISDLQKIIDDYGQFEINTSKKKKYHVEECVVFGNQDNGFELLSNTCNGCPIEINGIKTHGVETLYQAMKFPKYPDIQKMAIEATNPQIIEKNLKKYSIPPFIREDWENVKVDIMEWCVNIKYLQNLPTIIKLSRELRGKPIVNQSKNDDFWGAISLKKNPAILSGKNVLGQIWMKIMRGHDSIVAPLNIKDFTLYGEPIGVIK